VVLLIPCERSEHEGGFEITQILSRASLSFSLQSAMNCEERISRIFCSQIFPELIEWLFAGFSRQNFTDFILEIYVIRSNLLFLNRTKQRIYHCAGWQISPGSLPGFSGRHNTVRNELQLCAGMGGITYPSPRGQQGGPSPYMQQQGPPASLVGGLGGGATLSAGPQANQRVFTGTVTKLHDNFGFIDDEVFFQTSVCKGSNPR
jgi:hypothetical protein